ncbi:MAG: hypothetical protein ACRDIB_03730 [Ardenticatenaceae bacterium]
MTLVGEHSPNRKWPLPAGGSYQAQDLPFALTLSRGAVAEPVEVWIEPVTPTVALTETAYATVSLTVRNGAGVTLTSFLEPATLAGHLAPFYDELAAHGSPGFYRFDETSEVWESLDNTVNWQTLSATAALLQPGLLALANTDELTFGAQFLPTLEALPPTSLAATAPSTFPWSCRWVRAASASISVSTILPKRSIACARAPRCMATTTIKMTRTRPRISTARRIG